MKTFTVLVVLCGLMVSVHCICDQAAGDTYTKHFQSAIATAGADKAKLCAAIDTFVTAIQSTGCENNPGIKQAIDATITQLNQYKCHSTQQSSLLLQILKNLETRSKTLETSAHELHEQIKMAVGFIQGGPSPSTTR